MELKYYEIVGPRVILKYKNRKFYDTLASNYILLSDIVSLEPGTYKVLDYKTKLEITEDVLFTALMSKFSENDPRLNSKKQEITAHMYKLLNEKAV